MSQCQALIDDLEAALRNGSTERRTDILRRVADLFLGRCNTYSTEEVALFDTVILHLCGHIEHRALEQLSHRLAPGACALTSVIGRLARDDDIAVSGPVLAQSERLTDADLVEIAGSKGQQHLLKIAGRARLNEVVTDVLVDRGDSVVATEVAANAGARFSSSAFAKLVMWADGDERMTEAMAGRPDLPPHLIRQLLVRATDNVKARLLAVAQPEARDEIQRVLSEISNQINRAVNPRYYAEAKLLVRRFSQDTALTRRKLLEFADAHRLGESVAALSALSGLSIDLIDRLVLDPGHYGIMVLCKSMGFDWRTAHAVISIPRMGAGPRSLVIDEVYEEYQTLSTESAQRLLRFWQVRQTNPGMDGSQRKDDVVAVRRANAAPRDEMQPDFAAISR
jgi:uncharacterized protein (DUF2336 family)